MTWRRLAPWTFPSLGLGPDDVIITAEGDPPPRDDFEQLHPSLAYYLLNDWVSAHETREHLATLWLELTGERINLRSEPGGLDRRTAPIIEAFESERLLLWGPIRAGVTEPARIPTKPPLGRPRPQPRPQETWIEILLIDQDGRPVKEEPYEVTVPDGSLRSGRLDARGFCRLDGLEAGACDVSFPRIDGREWGASLPATKEDQGPAFEHEVLEHEDCLLIAARYGFRAWETVWMHARNRDLRKDRLPEMLFPGDRLVVPEREVRKEEAATGRRHRYVARVSSKLLRLRLLDFDREPLREAQYDLWIDGILVANRASTDADGYLERVMPAWAQAAILKCPIGEFELGIGRLNPARDAPDGGISGAQARLKNLGYDVGPIDGVWGPRSAEALRVFQREHELPPSEGLTSRVIDELIEAYGC